MGTPTRYYHHWRLANGEPVNRLIDSAYEFFQQQFPNQTEPNTDRQIQQSLFALYRDQTRPEAVSKAIRRNRRAAEQCLRCYISHQIYQTCRSLVQRYQQRYGLTLDQVLLYVLQDNSIHHPPTPNSLVSKILQTFDPAQPALLSTWTNRLTLHDRQLNRFLYEDYRIRFRSDWGLLSEATPNRIRRILTHYDCTEQEIIRFQSLWQVYSDIYINDNLQPHQLGKTRNAPTLDQLQRMVQALRKTDQLPTTPEQIKAALQELAEYLRNPEPQFTLLLDNSRYQSIDNLPAQVLESQPFALPDARDTVDQDLRQYLQEIIRCLDQAIAQVIPQRYQPNPPTERSQTVFRWLKAIYCEGRTASDLARAADIHQSNISRPLNLVNLRAAIKRETLALLRDQLPPLSQRFLNPDRILKLDAELDQVLETLLEQDKRTLFGRHGSTLPARAATPPDSVPSETPTAEAPLNLLGERLRLYLSQCP